MCRGVPLSKITGGSSKSKKKIGGQLAFVKQKHCHKKPEIVAELSKFLTHSENFQLDFSL